MADSGLKPTKEELDEITIRTLQDIQREMEEALKTQTAAELIARLNEEKDSGQYDQGMILRIQTTINYVRFVDENMKLVKVAEVQLERDKDLMFTQKQFKRWKKSNNISPDDEVLIQKNDGGKELLFRLTELWDYVIETVKWNMQQIAQPNFLGAMEYLINLNERIQSVRCIQRELLEIARATFLKIRRYKELTCVSTVPTNAADIMIDVYNQSGRDDFCELRMYVYCFSMFASHAEISSLFNTISCPGPLYDHSSGKRILWRGILDIIHRSFVCYLATILPRSKTIAEQLLKDFDGFMRAHVSRLAPNFPPPPTPPSSITRSTPSKRTRWVKNRDIQKQIEQVVINLDKMMLSGELPNCDLPEIFEDGSDPNCQDGGGDSAGEGGPSVIKQRKRAAENCDTVYSTASATKEEKEAWMERFKAILAAQVAEHSEDATLAKSEGDETNGNTESDDVSKEKKEMVKET